jgi:hypothetical protein
MNLLKNCNFLLLLFLLFPLLMKAQQINKEHLMLLEDADAGGRAAIAIHIPEMPDQKFVLEIPEVFTLGEVNGDLYNYAKQNWQYNPGGAELNYEDKKFQYAVKLKIISTDKSVALQWDITCRNNTSSTMYDVAAFNCWTMNFAPLFKDTKMERSWVYDINGKKKLLKEVAKTQGPGRRTMQFYPAAGGIADLSKSGWIQQWDVTSTETLGVKKISIVSTDGRWIFENWVNGKVAYFFNNWEEDHGCFHASPLLAKELKPGASAHASGNFKFTRLKK